jgi:PAS domain S-box-containing protein
MKARELVGPAVVHSGGIIRYANDEFCVLVGAEAPVAVIGESLAAFISESYQQQLSEQFDQITGENASVRGVTLELEHKSGTTRDAVAVSSGVEWEGESCVYTSFIDLLEPEEHRIVPLREVATHQSPIGVTIADASREDEPLIYVNDTFSELTGYPREEILGQNCRFLQGQATRAEPVAELRAAIEDERPTTVELRNHRKDGSVFWNRVTISPVEDEAGSVSHFLGFQQDITDAKIHERQKILFESHLDMTEQVVFITDTNGVIEYVNPAFERVTGYSAGEAVGKTPQILNSGKQDETFYEELWETITEGETWEAELTNQTKDGELYEVRQKIVPITDDRGEISHYLAIEVDITDAQLTQQVVDVLNRILRHNVRTSVNVIDGYAEVLETDPDDAQREAALGKIREHTDTLMQIGAQTTAIRDLLSGQEDPSPLTFRQLRSLVEQFRETYDSAHIDLRMHGSPDRTIRNGNVFQIAFEEVIENAVEHSDRETPQVEITVTVPEESDSAVVEIADDGPGIPESEWEIIRSGVETPLSHTKSLGLWLVYWSLTVLGGVVDLSTNEPRGSVLELEVPLTDESE